MLVLQICVKLLERRCYQKVLTVWHLTPQGQYALQSLSERPWRSSVVQHKQSWLLFSSMFPVQTWHPAAYSLSYKTVFLYQNLTYDPLSWPFCYSVNKILANPYRRMQECPVLTINKKAGLMHVAKCCRKVKEPFMMVYIQGVLNGCIWRKMLFVVIWCSYIIYQQELNGPC